MTLTLKEVYKPRWIRFLELWSDVGWQMKIYGITYEDTSADSELLRATKGVARNRLPQPALSAGAHGVGFIGIHQGRSYDFVFIDWWSYETELEHHSFMRPSSTSSTLQVLDSSELSSDVWDLRLQAFERDVWLDCVLKSKSPDLEKYLAQRLTERI